MKTNSGAEKNGEDREKNVRGKVVGRVRATCSKLRRDDGRLKARVDELIVNNTACGYFVLFVACVFFIQSMCFGRRRVFVIAAHGEFGDAFVECLLFEWDQPRNGA